MELTVDSKFQSNAVRPFSILHREVIASRVCYFDVSYFQPGFKAVLSIGLKKKKISKLASSVLEGAHKATLRG